MRNSYTEDLSKENLYESVKTLIECDDNHKLLNQHKLFTLYSIAFQYMLYTSTKVSGAYIIRIDTPQLAEKLARKAKDSSSRKFLQSLMLPRRFKYGKSVFYLDFFNIGSWNLTNEIPAEKIKGALIVKNTSSQIMDKKYENEDTEEEVNPIEESLGEHYYLKSLMPIADTTITIAFDEDIPDVKAISFPFIKKDKEQLLSGVTVSESIDLE